MILPTRFPRFSPIACPSTTIDLDWTELVTTVTWKGDYWLQAGWSNGALATGEAGAYVQAGARTDGAAARLFPGLAGSRVEAALQASF